MGIDRVKIRSAAPRDDAPQWRREMESGAWLGTGARLKQTVAGVVVATRMSVNGRDTEVVVKTFHLDGPWARLKSMFGHGRAGRHARASARLASAGIQTPRVLVAGAVRIDGRAHDFLVMERHPGTTLIDAMHRSARHEIATRTEHAIARALGEQVGSFRIANLFNRDHKPSNVMMSVEDGGIASLAVIDCVAIARATGVRGGATNRMFASLMIEPTGLGIPPRRSLRMRVVRTFLDRMLRTPGALGPGTRSAYRQARRAVWDEVSRLVADHGDPRPRDNPLAHPASMDAAR